MVLPPRDLDPNNNNRKPMEQKQNEKWFEWLSEKPLQRNLERCSVRNIINLRTQV